MTFFQIFLFAYVLSSSPIFTTSQPFDYPTATLSTSWINSVSANHSIDFTDGSTIRAILLRGTFGPRYACGFYCKGNCETYLFAIFIVQTNSGGGITSPSIGFPQVVWSANPNNPVRINSTLQLTYNGDLVLKDVDGTLAWSTNTARRSVAGLNLTEMGNLILFDENESVVWQSFDHHTDCLVPGQRLKSGQNLTASVSSSNWTQGGIYLSMTNQGLIASIRSNPPQVYFEYGITNVKLSYAMFINGSLDLYTNSTETSPLAKIDIPPASSAQYIKLDYDGHLKIFEWLTGWKEVAEITTGYLGECNYPMVCGENGICSNGQCSCPTSTTDSANYFKLIDGRQPNLGCSQVIPLTCDASKVHKFLDLDEATYFTFTADISSTNINRCKEACLKNCSCKAVIFRYGSNSFDGDCYLPSQIFSLMNNEKDKSHYNSTISIKVQVPPSAIPPSVDLSPASATKGKKSPLGTILGSGIGILLSTVAIGFLVFIIWKKRKNLREEIEEDFLDQLPGMPTRFSFEDLKNATENFNKKLGEGGFGSVFQGTLKDGTEIAVKCLDEMGQVKKSFLAEAETIGSIHHVNLVRLIGFCADKSHRHLVYEYMKNGSLDKWIYGRTTATPLDWKCRKKIILDIARGLSYLHEECRQKIVHLDIKPQNILLDENFNAKLSDFGLSKLIDRNQSQVVTNMRGTPGYLAPEWLSSVITEKVDVYSFGIVILEILCGRRNFEKSEPEEERHLLSLFKTKAQNGQWLDLIDKHSEDMQSHGGEVVEMMQVAVWCLQGYYANRPSMSTVIKVLEGVKDVEKDLDYNFVSPEIATNRIPEVDSRDATPLLPSTLSGPR
ncbi:G-type lectin S-receptor-like serine threonine-kinase SD2-5 [Olea europaea subsp. europaea]|uniref:Receptor-like serine/threonine-protein kinase n=1 Tax=Olea europaea subsp. europaea TaxID=158383 RepID=A0A8S0T3G4_OLEEU|nr:G-type lectin S-receptor-like serine threonine-kinase SD2-5 [Olea europaea subsp. europaea]